MLINKMGQNTSFKNSMKNYITHLKGSDNQINVEKIKRDVLQKQSDKQYEKDLKDNRRSIIFFITTAVVCAIGALVSKKRGEWIIGSSFMTAGAILSHIEKPKKENYDKQVENDIKKEIENENIANK